MISFKPRWGLTLAMLAALAVLLRLGFWQLDRLEWKLALIEEAETRSQQSPVTLMRLAVERGENHEYRPVVITGIFEHDKEAHRFLTSLSGQAGYHILTPLRLLEGGYVYINRGFVPFDKKEPETRKEGQVTGPVTVTGLYRGPQEPLASAAKSNPEKNEWHSRDLVAMAEVHGLENVMPFSIDADGSEVPGGLPRGGQTRLIFTNDHLGYAVTWFGLAIALLGVYLAFHIREGRLSVGGKEK